MADEHCGSGNTIIMTSPKNADGTINKDHIRPLAETNKTLHDSNEINNDNSTPISNTTNEISSSPPKDLSTRCNLLNCNKRFGVIPFQCKCGLKFCSMHRHSFDHNCSYDHKADTSAILKKSMIQVAPEKIKKI